MTSQSKATTVLVTGATGFIGFELCTYLLHLGYSVKVLLRGQDQVQLFTPHEHLTHCIGCVEDFPSLQRACCDIDVVIHLAGIAHVNSAGDDLFQKINIKGTDNLLKASIEQGVKRIIFMSSSLAHAAETSEGDVTAYGQSKLTAERNLKSAHDRGDIEVVILRPVNVYGPGMKGNIVSMISMIDRGLLPGLPKIDSQISLVGVNDLAIALGLTILSSEASGKTYNITDGEKYSISAIEAAIYDVLGKEFPRWRTPHFVVYTAAVSAGWLLGLRSLSRKLVAAIAGGNKRKASKGGGISGRTYHNLVSENLFSNELICHELGFKPSTTLYLTLPNILKTDFNK